MNSMQQNQQFQTKQLVNDYIGWRLAKEGYSQWNVLNKVDTGKNSKIKICLIMRQMAFEFEKRYNSDYLPLSDQFTISTDYLNEMFPLILAELFQIKTLNQSIMNESLNQSGSSAHQDTGFNCNWCRVIALFSFAGCLALRCYRTETPNSIHEIVEWLIKFLNCDQRVFSWIESKGGWNGFIEFFNDDKINIIKNTNNSSFSEKHKKMSEPSMSKSSGLQQENSFENKNFELNKFELLQLNAKSVFCKLSKYMAITVGSLGVITIGLIYIRKN